MASFLNKRPELRDLVNELSGISWDSLKQVLLDLGVPKHRLDDIEGVHPTSVSSRRMSALDCWLQLDVHASWERVAKALMNCFLLAEAVKLAQKYDCVIFPEEPHLCGTSEPHLCGTSESHLVPVSDGLPYPSDKPTLAQLRRLKTPGGKDIQIIHQVAGKWDDIAIAMDFDPEGHTQTAINRDFSTVQEKCRETFKKWLQGHGSRKPATWEILVEILRDCDFENLATDIETSLQ